MKEINNYGDNFSYTLKNYSKIKIITKEIILSLFICLTSIIASYFIFDILNFNINFSNIIRFTVGISLIDSVKRIYSVNKENNRNKVKIKNVIEEVNKETEMNISVQDLKNAVKIEKELKTDNEEFLNKQTDYYLLDSKDKLIVLRQITEYLKTGIINKYNMSKLYLLEENDIQTKEIPKRLLKKNN